MKLRELPLDILICLLWSIIFFIFAIFDNSGVIRIILGIPFLLFIPGYVVLFTIFPEKNLNSKISVIERIIVSIGLSIAISALIGLSLNYTPLKINIVPYLTIMFTLTILLGLFGLYRWFSLKIIDRFIFPLNLRKSKNKLNSVLNLLIILSFIIASLSFIFVISTPENNEKFTSLYILNQDKNSIDYPSEINIGKETNIIIGASNHEKETIDYTLDIWIINQDIDQNKIIYENLWFIDKTEFSLKHQDIDLSESWMPQLEQNISILIENEEIQGNGLKLAFLLYKHKTDDYERYKDYKSDSSNIINNAYRTVYLWANITN